MVSSPPITYYRLPNMSVVLFLCCFFDAIEGSGVPSPNKTQCKGRVKKRPEGARLACHSHTSMVSRVPYQKKKTIGKAPMVSTPTVLSCVLLQEPPVKPCPAKEREGRKDDPKQSYLRGYPRVSMVFHCGTVSCSRIRPSSV